MDATLTDRSAMKSGARWTEQPAAAFLLEIFILCAVMTAPFFLLDKLWWGMAAVGLVYVGYLVWMAATGWRNRKAHPSQPLKLNLILMTISLSNGSMIVGLASAAVTGWFFWAYRVEIIPELVVEKIWLISGICVVGHVVIVALIKLYPGREGGQTTKLRAAIRKKGLAPFYLRMFYELRPILSPICLAAFALCMPVAYIVLENLNTGVAPSIWELAVAFPFLPLALIAGAVMLSMTRRFDGESQGEIVKAYLEDAAEPAKSVSRPGVVALACGAAITFYVALYPVHIGLVAALSGIAGLPATVETAETIEKWAEAEREDGRAEAELAAILNQYGSWNPDSPEAGIPALFPELKEAMPVGDDETGAAACGMTVAAAVTANQAAPDLKYCIRTACPSPVAWDAPDTVMLASSHSSRNEQWVDTFFIDIFAEGSAPAPGGYCTADGELADDFQG